jgi:membrane protein implicated in regulation of membrane protease activity
MPGWVVYSAARVAIFAAVLALLLVLGVEWWLAAIIAAVIGFCVAYIFFRPLRARVADELAAARQVRRTADEVAEDVEDVDSEGDRGRES